MEHIDIDLSPETKGRICDQCEVIVGRSNGVPIFIRKDEFLEHFNHWSYSMS